MLEMWVLVWVSLYDPAYGVSVDGLGTFSDIDSCIYEMREAEIMVNRSNEGMLCLRVGPEGMWDVHKSDHGLQEELQ